MVPADADLRIKLPVFEGPLDLLLFLIRKNELDIYDIPIAAVTKQYIAVLRSMQQLDLEIAGEFFVMAASLMEIKSRMLLPRGAAATGESDDDDPLDPRWELVHQLLQYKKFKEAAAKLDELASFQRDMLARQVVEVAVTENERPLKPVDRIELWNSFNLVLRRLAEKLVVGEIKGEEVTVSDKMEELLKLIETRKTFLFTDLFEGEQVTVRLLVATFIAVLELTRLKKLRVRQDEAYGDIHVEAVENTTNADGSLAAGQLNFAPDAPDHTTSDAARPAFTLSADGYAAIPAVLDADAPRPPTIETEMPSAPESPLAESAPMEPAPTSSEPTPSPLAVEPDPGLPPFAAELDPTLATDLPPAAGTALTETPETPSPAASVALEPEILPPAAAEAAVAEIVLAASSAAEPEVPVEPAPVPPTDQPSAPPEQILRQNPLDTEPPRDTLTS